MRQGGQDSRPRDWALKAIDIVILTADALVVGFLLFLFGTVAIVGTDSTLYNSTGGWIFSVIQNPGFSQSELVVYAVGALVVLGPIWHGMARPAPKQAGSESPRLDSDDAFEFASVDESSSSNRSESGLVTANGGRRSEENHRTGADWTGVVFGESDQSTRQQRGAIMRSPSDDISENTIDSGPEEESVSTTYQGKPGPSSKSIDRESDQPSHRRNTSDTEYEASDGPTEIRLSSDDSSPTELIPAVLSSSRERIRHLERHIEQIDDQTPIDNIEDRVEEPLERGGRFESLVDSLSRDSPTLSESVAAVRGEQRRIESAFTTDLGPMREEFGSDK